MQASWLRRGVSVGTVAALLLTALWSSSAADPGADRADLNGWAVPAPMDSYAGDGASVAIDDEGRGVAVWIQFEESTNTYPVKAATMSADGTWTTVAPLTDIGGRGRAHAAIGPLGHGAAAWLSSDKRVMVSLRPPDGAWSDPIQVTAPIRVDRQPPFSERAIVVGSSGRTRVAWREGERIQVSEISPEGNVTEPVVVSTTATARAPQLTEVGDGSTTVWWAQPTRERGRERMVATRWFEDHSWSSRYLVAPSVMRGREVVVATDGLRAAVAIIDRAGRPVVRETTTGDVYRTTWTGKAPRKFRFHHSPSLSVTGGRVMFTFSTLNDAIYTAVRKTIVRNRAGTWGRLHSARVVLATGEHSYRLQAGMTRRGRVVVVWNGRTGVRVQERSARGRWQKSYLLSADAYRPRLAMNPAGDAILTWGTEGEEALGPNIQQRVTQRRR